MTFLSILLALWAGLLVLRLLGMALLRSPVPAYTGFRIQIPEEAVVGMSAEEIEGIRAHEEGHRYYAHPWRNFLLSAFFIPITHTRRIQQELEADDYCMRRGHGHAFASALRKRSLGGIDHFRTVRLERYQRVRPSTIEEYRG